MITSAERREVVLIKVWQLENVYEHGGRPIQGGAPTKQH